MLMCEIRTEEERVGNVFLLMSEEKYESHLDAIEKLWVEAQDYDEQYSYEKKINDFKKEKFSYRRIAADEFIEKSKKILLTISACSNESVEEVSVNSIKFCEDYLLNINSISDEIYLLEESFSDYFVYIKNHYRHSLFSWSDVI